jgi:hypothetical protein
MEKRRRGDKEKRKQNTANRKDAKKGQVRESRQTAS